MNGHSLLKMLFLGKLKYIEGLSLEKTEIETNDWKRRKTTNPTSFDTHK